MKPLPHLYRTHLTGGKAGYAIVGSESLPDLRTAPPADFDGPGDAWSPEQFLMAAVETCFLFTFRAVAQASKLEFTYLEVKGEGTVDRKDGATRFTQIVLRPRLTVPSGTDIEKARRIVEKSEKACLISASLSTPVHLEPEIVVD
ncbi:MAG TPA: OsmC family protein [Candidatus Binataceae bacterium]|nr:OsmC family protein [Candidatus Binataceae bacterium]